MGGGRGVWWTWTLHFISLHLTSFIHIRLPLEDQSPLTKQSKTSQSITVWEVARRKKKREGKRKKKLMTGGITIYHGNV